MNNLAETTPNSQGAEENNPDVSQAGGKHQAGQAAGVRDMAFVQMKAAAFLVGEEGFNSEPFGIVVTGFWS